jgi:DmsE family decaheme c-type cytochrome
MRPSLALLVALCAIAAPAVGAEGAPPQRPPHDSAAASSGPTLCAACHHDQAASLVGGPHAGSPGGVATSPAADASCVPCHGDPADHLEVGGGRGNLFAFGGATPPGARAARCQACHGATLPRFAAGPHAAAGVDCTGCHRIHGDAEGETGRALLASEGSAAATPEPHRVGSPSRICRGCHLDVFAQFEFNERHRLRAGVLECTSCHDPHGPGAGARLGGFDRQPCATCHSDKDGPFVFEHGAQIVDGCVACHSPHGSPNRRLLTFQSTAALCYSCHAAVPGSHSRFTLDTVCTQCHAAIHGSNLDPWFLQ